MISNLEEIKQKIDIVEVIGRFVPLKKDGVNYTCCCPFHEEKSPSFKVNPNKQIYHCFGCGAGGDAIKFVQEYKRLNFQEAVQEVTDLLGLEIKIQAGKNAIAEYFALNAKVNDICLENLRQKPQVLKYLKNRGLSEEDFALFDIGYIPQDLARHFNLEEINKLIEIGLLYRNANGSLFVPLHDRISFAIRNFNHKIVGFSARTHPYCNFKNSAKYINSKESRIFHKSQLLYGISLAKRHIASSKECYIVEGFIDVIAMHKLGFKNTIATCGTAFNTQHLSAINRVCDGVRIHLCFDKDAAGEKASLKGAQMLFFQGFLDSFVAKVNAKCKDLGELLENPTPPTFSKTPIAQYYIEESLNHLQSAKEKDSFINDIKTHINAQKNFFAKTLLVDTLKELGIPYESQKSVSAQENYYDLTPLALLKSCMQDENALNLCIDYLEPIEFGRFKDDFLALLRNSAKTELLQKISIDENIKPLEFKDVRFGIFELKFRFLKWQLQQAKFKGDTETMLRLNQALAQLKDIKPA